MPKSFSRFAVAFFAVEHEMDHFVVDGAHGSVEVIEDVRLGDHEHILIDLARGEIFPGIGKLPIERGQADAADGRQWDRELAELGRFDGDQPVAHAERRPIQSLCRRSGSVRAGRVGGDGGLRPDASHVEHLGQRNAEFFTPVADRSMIGRQLDQGAGHPTSRQRRQLDRRLRRRRPRGRDERQSGHEGEQFEPIAFHQPFDLCCLFAFSIVTRQAPTWKRSRGDGRACRIIWTKGDVASFLKYCSTAS